MRNNSSPPSNLYPLCSYHFPSLTEHDLFTSVLHWEGSLYLENSGLFYALCVSVLLCFVPHLVSILPSPDSVIILFFMSSSAGINWDMAQTGRVEVKTPFFQPGWYYCSKRKTYCHSTRFCLFENAYKRVPDLNLITKKLNRKSICQRLLQLPNSYPTFWSISKHKPMELSPMPTQPKWYPGPCWME